MDNYKRKHSLLIGGKMSKKGADKAGYILAWCVGIATILFGLSTLIYVIKIG